MISGATAAVALVVTPSQGLWGAIFFAATILMGLIQLLLGILKVGRLLKFIPRSVMIGFECIRYYDFLSQIEHIFGISIDTYIYVTITLLIVFILPKFFTIVPAPLIAIVVLTILYLTMVLIFIQ